jgi:DNA transformation protein
MDNTTLKDLLLARLDGLPVTARAMFGGYGLYLEGSFFGVIAKERVYFRTDDASRPEYIERGMPAFQPQGRPRGPKTVDRNFEVPEDVLAEPASLRKWAMRAAEAYRNDRRR